MNGVSQALSTIVESSNIDLAISGWLDGHKRSLKTYNTYRTAIAQFRAGLQRMGKDLDTDVSTIMLAAQAFASGTIKRPEVSQATYNLRLAILCSFYDYAMSRYLIMPMDHAGHVLNPMKAIKREKVQRYKGVHAIEPEEAMNRIQAIDRTTLQGKRDYALLAILLETGRRLQEVTHLEWQHVQLAGRGKKRTITLTFEHCKGDKTMIDTLPASISAALLAWLYAYYGVDLASLEKTAPLWVTLSRNTTQRGQALGIQAVQQICEKYLETHAHVTRHTFTYLMIKAGATLPEIQARLGHESLATTGIYARVLTSHENPHADTLAKMLGFE
jgi:integrase